MHKSAILITGGNGYLGFHTGLLFAQQQQTIIFLDTNFLHSYPWALYIKGDYGDNQLLRSLFNTYYIDAILHCAPWQSPLTEHLEDYQHVAKTIMLLENAHAHHIKKFIIASCASIYGNYSGIMHHETPKQPSTSFGKSMNMIEDIMHDYAQLHALNYVALRFFNIAGRVPKYETHTMHDAFMQQLMHAFQKNSPISLYDTDYQTSDGSIIRDYIHIWDAAHAQLAAYRYLYTGATSDYFNIGSNRGFSAKELVHIAEKLFNKKIKIITQKQNKKISASMIADISKTVDLLGWQPQFSDIELIIKTACF